MFNLRCGKLRKLIRKVVGFKYNKELDKMVILLEHEVLEIPNWKSKGLMLDEGFIGTKKKDLSQKYNINL